MDNKKRLIIFAKTKGLFLFLMLLALQAFMGFVRHLLLSNKFLSSIKFINEIFSDDVYFLLVVFLVIFSVIGISYRLYRKKFISFLAKDNWYYSMEKAFFPAITAFGLGLFSALIIVLIFEYLPTPEVIRNWLKAPNGGFIILFDSLNNKEHLKVMLIFFLIIVAGPILEEILFRGFLQDTVSRIIKNKKAVIIFVSFLFSLAHFFSLSNMIFAFIVGIFLSKNRSETGNINTTIWIHAIINFTGLLSGIIYKYIGSS